MKITAKGFIHKALRVLHNPGLIRDRIKNAVIIAMTSLACTKQVKVGRGTCN